MPRDLGVRQELEYHGEEHCDQRQRQNGVHNLGQCLHSRDHAAEPLSHKRDGCREKKGNQEQEANHQDKTKGEDSILDNAEDAPPRLGLNAPDCIERGLQLPENARRSKKQCHDSD